MKAKPAKSESRLTALRSGGGRSMRIRVTSTLATRNSTVQVK